jgi:antitoxin CptB
VSADNTKIYDRNTMNQLKWACRRGMLELDILLSNYLNEAFINLDDQHKADFVNFLTYPDPEILSWIMGNAEPADPTVRQMAKAIHDHARSRLST